MTTLGPLIDAADLLRRLDGPAPPVVCDVRWYLDGRSGRAAYDAGHLPGAVFADLDDWMTGTPGPDTGRHPFPSPRRFAHGLGSLGIGPGTQVVAYDDAGGMSAGRLVWMLRILGQPAALLDGGLGAWGGPLDDTPTVRVPADCPARPWPDDALASIDETARHPGPVLDARAGDRFRGEIEPVDPRAGHVPGAVSAPFAGNLADGRFRPTGELRARYEGLGVDAATDAVVYCGSGVSACHDLLAMEHAGLGRGRQFVGSWSHWSHTHRPAAPGP